MANETGVNEDAVVDYFRKSYNQQQQRQLIPPATAHFDSSDEDEKIFTLEKEQPHEQHQQLLNGEIRECPMCYWEFPLHFSLENKHDHINNHF